MDQQKVIGSFMGNVLQKKLQERVMDVAGKGKGKTTPDMIELVDLAERLNDEDSLWVLNEKFREIGEIQSRRNLNARKNRKEKNEREKRLEDYVEKNAGQVEDGLEFVSRQDVLHSGRTDVIARDLQGRDVVVELKAAGYDAGEVFHQISRYAGEKEGSRIVFAAPEIDPKLYFAIKANPLLMERMDFVRVEENDDGTFGFVPFEEREFGDTPKHAKYDFTNSGKGKHVDEDTVEVVKQGSKAKSVRRQEKSADPREELSSGERIIPLRDLASSLPYVSSASQYINIKMGGNGKPEVQIDESIPDNLRERAVRESELLLRFLVTGLDSGEMVIARKDGRYILDINDKNSGGSRKANYQVSREGNVTRIESDDLTVLVEQRGWAEGYRTDVYPKIEGLDLREETTKLKVNEALEIAGIPKLSSLNRIGDERKIVETSEVSILEGEERSVYTEFASFILSHPSYQPIAGPEKVRDIVKCLEEKWEVSSKEIKELDVLSEIGSGLEERLRKYDALPAKGISDIVNRKFYVNPSGGKGEARETSLGEFLGWGEVGVNPHKSKMRPVVIALDFYQNKVHPKMIDFMDEFGGVYEIQLHQGLDLLDKSSEICKVHNQRQRSFSGDSVLVKARKKIREMVDIMDSPDDSARVPLGLLSDVFSDIPAAYTDYMRLKFERTRRLADIDSASAWLYFNHSYNAFFNHNDLQKEASGCSLVGDYAREDTELYRRIISRFEVVEGEPVVERKVPEPVKAREPESEMVLTPVEKFEDNILRKVNGDYTSDMKARIRYFAEDAVSAGLDGDRLEELGASISSYLHKKMRDRGKAPSDLQIRTFLDDITLDHVSKGKIPGNRELDKAYEFVIEEFPRE
jgi:hypothetical protein